MILNSAQVPYVNLSNNSSTLFNINPLSNFNPLTDSVHIEGMTVVFTHYWTVNEVITALAPVWIILYILLSIAIFYYVKRSHNAN
jgi:hypothetical protein